MHTYSSYKSISHTWFSQLPCHWKYQKLGLLFTERIKKVSDKMYQPLSVTKMGILPQLSTAIKAANGDDRKLVKTGDFVINSRSDRKGSCGIAHQNGSVSLINIVLIPNDSLIHQYIHYLLRSYYFSEEFYRNGKGIVGDLWTTRYSDMKNILLPIPPVSEQRKIVNFLDWKTSVINELITLTTKEIYELESLKHSYISNTVMGQNKKCPMKKAEISWSTQIPAHWEEKSLIQVAEEKQIKNTGMKETNLLSLSYGRIIPKSINSNEGLLPDSFEGYQIVEKNNIILRMTDLQNDHKSLRTGLVTEKGIITSAYLCLKVRNNILPEYLQLQLHVADLCKVFYGLGGGVRQKIGFQDIRKLHIAVPPIEEQRKILEAVRTVEAPINDAIQMLRDMIDSLNDLKQRLIADVVTGQVDVRDVVIPEYEHIDEAPDEDDAGEER